MISIELTPEGRGWSAVATLAGGAELELGPTRLDLLEKGLRELHAAEGESWKGSQAKDLLDSAKTVEEAERRGGTAEALAGSLSSRRVAELESAHAAARSEGVLRG